MLLYVVYNKRIPRPWSKASIIFDMKRSAPSKDFEAFTFSHAWCINQKCSQVFDCLGSSYRTSAILATRCLCNLSLLLLDVLEQIVHWQSKESNKERNSINSQHPNWACHFKYFWMNYSGYMLHVCWSEHFPGFSYNFNSTAIIFPYLFFLSGKCWT